MSLWEGVHKVNGHVFHNIHILFFLSCSLSGLSRHKEVCTRPSSDTSKSLMFTCGECQRTFGEERYLKQHTGGKKCQQRRQFLERTASFSLALTESPGSVRLNATSSVRSFSTSSVLSSTSEMDKV